MNKNINPVNVGSKYVPTNRNRCGSQFSDEKAVKFGQIKYWMQPKMIVENKIIFKNLI